MSYFSGHAVTFQQGHIYTEIQSIKICSKMIISFPAMCHITDTIQLAKHCIFEYKYDYTQSKWLGYGPSKQNTIFAPWKCYESLKWGQNVKIYQKKKKQN
jgi:hypothetical protein